MVGVLARLKLSLLRNALRQSAWRIVGLALTATLGLGLLLVAVLILVAARTLSVENAGSVVVLGGAALVTGWLLLPVLLFGVDETLDPGRFALFPLTAGQLLPGLLAAGTLGVPGVVTTIVALSTVVTWTRGPFTAGVALLGAVLGILICLLSARALTSAFARVLGSRRFRDLAGVVMILTFIGVGVGVNALNAQILGSAEQIGERASRIAVVLGWTPLGWPWSAAVEAAHGRPVTALVKLILSAGLVLALAAIWRHFLARLLVSPLAAGAGAVRLRSGRMLLERALPSTPVGATTLRCLRYLRRDPRYLTSVAGVIVAPVVLVAANLATVGISPWIVWAPIFVGWAVGASSCQDTSYDGSAFWTHVTVGIEGRVDRAGRAVAQLLWSGPLLAFAVLGLVALTGRWDLLPGVVGLSSASLLCGIGVAAWVSARWPGPVPPAGANPFGSGSGTSAESIVALLVTSTLVVVLTVPVAALALASIRVPSLAWALLVIGPVWGLLVLAAGVRLGGRHLDSHWPEVLHKVSNPAA